MRKVLYFECVEKEPMSDQPYSSAEDGSMEGFVAQSQQEFQLYNLSDQTTNSEKQDLSSLRRDYGQDHDPWLASDAIMQAQNFADISWYELFSQWFNLVLQSDQPEPNAMVVASVGAEGMLRTRTVLAKEINPSGVIFYTNYESIKGRSFALNPQAAATFLWLSVHRQVQFSGTVQPVDAAISDAYWQTRPRESQIGAWASQQSQPVDSQAQLEEAFLHYQAEFADCAQIPRPERWGGYILIPVRVEFWAGRSGRMHDRLQFLRSDIDVEWTISRLQP